MKLPLISLLVLASVSAQAEKLTIELDRSGSNPLLIDQNFATQAAIFAAENVSKLKHGDTVEIRNFGDRSEAINIQSTQIEIGRQNRSSKVAKEIANYIHNIPEHHEKGQSSTNILALLEFGDFDCADGEVILLVTDGLEASEYISGDDFKKGARSLPEPDVDLSGCEVIFYGLGIGWQPSEVKNVRNGWRAYFDKAGATFTAITP